MMNFEAVIFDLDGTLIDSMGIWLQVDKEFLEKRNIPLPKDLFQDVDGGNSFTEIADYFKQKFSLPESIEEIMQEWTEMVADHYQNNVSLKKGASKFLHSLRMKKMQLAIGTSNSRYLTEIVLKANKVFQYFDSIIAGCDDIKGKPFPDIYLRVAEELNVQPEKCLVFEDVLVGVQAAKNAGMTVCAIEDEHVLTERKLIKQISDFYIKDFRDVKDLRM